VVKRYGELCMEARAAIIKNEGTLAAATARELVAFAAGKTVAELLRDYDLYAPDSVTECANRLLTEYLAGKPLAYILGEWSFYGLSLRVEPGVLIPRDDTMVVTNLAMQAIKQTASPRVLDLCCGTGCIGIAIARRYPDARVTLGDISDTARRVAKENIARNGLGSRVSVLKVNALERPDPFLGKFDVIVSNPPYISRREMDTLEPSVRDYEPHLALLGGEDGLDFYRSICRDFSAALINGGTLCLEFGMGQETAVEKILLKNQFGDLQFAADSANIIRAVAARKQ